MPRRSSVELPAGRFSYLEHGTGEPVVLVHALGRSAEDWTTVMESLGSRWRCLALDQRGHGHSVRTDEYSFEALADDLAAFVDALGLHRFSLLAHSMGATAGWIFAERTPDRLHRFVVEDTAPPAGHRSVAEAAPSPPEPVDYDWEARRQLLPQLGEPDPSWWDDIGKVTTPTLLVSGAQSANAARLTDAARLLPRSELVTLEAGHWIHETQPDAFVDTVRRFMME